jgi:nucleoside-diphosphate-sugar epimerase
VSKLKVLVIGADGFVGAAVMKALESTDWAIAAAGDARNLQQLAGSDAIVNAVSNAPAKIRESADTLYPNAERAATRPRIVHLSSMTVYGSVADEVDETRPLCADLGEYASAHLQAESRAAAYGNSVILRPGCEYGPHCREWSERIARLLQARRIGDLGAAGDGYCNLIYIDDLVRAVMQSLRITGIERQAFNLAIPGPPTWNEYFALFSKALGAGPLARISRRRLRLETKLLAPPLRIAEIAARSMRLPAACTPAVFSPSLARSCTQEIRLNSRKAEQLLGMSWTDLSAGLARTAGWISGARAAG